jgi:aryl-alcohol dehydrogenase-like predicted oxidoreductase
MKTPNVQRPEPRVADRRQFLENVGKTTALGVGSFVAGGRPAIAEERQPAADNRLRKRKLGKTGLMVSEIGFGGHSWSFKRVPDGRGGLRQLTLAESDRIVRVGLEMGVNLFDSCTPREEHTIPGQIIRQLGIRDQVIVSARCCHKMKGVRGDREEVYKFVDERLRQWQTDYFDILMLTNETYDTAQSGYWDMSYCIEALEEVRKQGKIRFTGFGCHFEPESFLDAVEKHGDFFDIVSFPYNIRHRAAERIMPVAEKAGLGIVTIKAFARGELLKDRDLQGADQGLPRSMIAYVLHNKLVDCCICGVVSEVELRENLSASWSELTDDEGRRLEALAANTPCHPGHWLEKGWQYA